MERKNIALLLGDIRDVYSNAVSKGALRAAKELGCNLLIVPGRYYQAREDLLRGEYEYQYQTLFSYFYEQNVDLIILCAGVTGFVSNTDGRNSLDKFLEQVGSIPVITISGDSDRLPNIHYNNSSGLCEGINYMIREQECHMIAMVAGPKNNLDSKDRVNAYKKTLLSNGMLVSDNLIVYGDFTERTKSLVLDLFRRFPDIDGVVFANDRMAIGGYEAMRELGLVVGRDVAFLGFDNIEKCNYIDPPLASVDADASDLGFAAVMQAIKYLETGIVSDRAIPSKFVLRPSILLHNKQEIMQQVLGYEINEDVDLEQLLNDTFRYIYNPKDGDESNRKVLFENYRRFIIDMTIITFSENIFPHHLDALRFSFSQVFDEDRNSDIDIGRFILVLDAIENSMMKRNPSPSKYEMIVRMTSHAYKYLSAIISLRELDSSYRMKWRLHEIYRISADMVGFHNISDKTYATVMSKFHRFGIKHAFLLLFDNPIRNDFEDEFTPDKELYLKTILNNGSITSLSRRDQFIPVSDIYEYAFSYFDNPGHLIMLNLYVRNMIYGVLLCDIPYDIFNFYESLNFQVSSAVRMIRLLQENEETGRQLKESLELMSKNNIELDSISKSDEMTGILNRRGFLYEANRLLRNAESANNGYSPAYVVVGYADADGLKYVNDTFGHDEGDVLIKACANVLKSISTSKSVIGRMGGDEFAMLMITDDAEMREFLQKEMKTEIINYNNSYKKPYQLSISFGTFLFDYSKELEINELLTHADKEMYEIKKERHTKRGEKI